MVLRVEDTDASKKTQEFVDAIVEPLQWLGLDWDEGPYFQSERLSYHAAAVQQLIDSGHAYFCDLSRDEIDLKAEEAGLPPATTAGRTTATSSMVRALSSDSGRPTRARR